MHLVKTQTHELPEATGAADRARGATLPCMIVSTDLRQARHDRFIEENWKS